MENTPTKYVNTPMTGELIEKLDTMVETKESTRAQFIRLLVRQAWERHQAEQNTREAEGLDVLKKKVRNGGRQIKQIRAEQ